MTEELPLLFDRIRVLLDRQRSDSAVVLNDAVEHTLTDGYAGALRLEGERERMRKRIRELAADAESAEHARELQTLMGRLHRTEEELTRLRDLLRVLAGSARAR